MMFNHFYCKKIQFNKKKGLTQKPVNNQTNPTKISENLVFSEQNENNNYQSLTFIDNFCIDADDLNIYKKIYDTLLQLEQKTNYFLMSLNFEKLKLKNEFISEFTSLCNNQESLIINVQFATVRFNDLYFKVDTNELLKPKEKTNINSQNFKDELKSNFYIPKNIFSRFSFKFDFFIREISQRELLLNVSLPLVFQNKTDDNCFQIDVRTEDKNFQIFILKY